ncbi:hypothetical protein SCUCBS95973_001621 [Sporothrix curviconia]|uniref:Uncharacterized protein n=1 Tax=Sporothrix curviconia TaxID=1260050 RepID=A0ABP0B031_9PEZI
MSFMATLFTINLDVWTSPLPLPYVAKYTFNIGLGISIPLVVITLTVTDIIAATRRGLVAAKNVLIGGWAPSGSRTAVRTPTEAAAASAAEAAAAADIFPLESTVPYLATQNSSN